MNNAGVGYTYPEYYHYLENEKIDALVNVNCAAMVYFTAAVLGPMAQRKKGTFLKYFFRIFLKYYFRPFLHI